MTDSDYIGRFAPSPSGELHFGSLIAALGSYLQARAKGGIWRVRIEDIDPPREVPGAADTICDSSIATVCTGTARYCAAQRHDAYRERLTWLRDRDLCYYCTCTRARIHSVGGIYDGHCRDLRLGAENAALRLRQTRPVLEFYDQLRGTLVADEPLAREDFIIHRRDGLFAYNLAVVVDDHFQGVSEIVRGADLIEPTVRQISLYQHFGWPVPDYVHLPLALNAEGNKLSKQNHAPALPEGDPRPEIVRALTFLNQDVVEDWQALSIDDLLKQAIANWQPAKIQHSQMAPAEL